MKLVSLGTDVEFVAKDKTTNKLIPLSPSIIDGTKDSPFPITTQVQVQLDNVLGELTFSPTGDSRSFSSLCTIAKLELDRYLSAKNLKAVWLSHHSFKPHELLSSEALTIGCEPDFPANENDDPAQTKNIVETSIRTGSGHIHVGLSREASTGEIIRLVRILDFAVGLPLVLAHNDPVRRQFYGQAGRFRFKDYGFEYRTPDNWWFSRSDYMARRIYETISFCIYKYSTNPAIDSYINKYYKLVCEGINQGDLDKLKYVKDAAGTLTTILNTKKRTNRPNKKYIRKTTPEDFWEQIHATATEMQQSIQIDTAPSVVEDNLNAVPLEDTTEE